MPSLLMPSPRQRRPSSLGEAQQLVAELSFFGCRRWNRTGAQIASPPLNRPGSTVQFTRSETIALCREASGLTKVPQPPEYGQLDRHLEKTVVPSEGHLPRVGPRPAKSRF